MAEKCLAGTGIPTVLNKKGEEVESRLFKDLLSLTTREEATKHYLRTKSSFFINTWNPKLTLDENGEPTLASLLEKTNLSDAIENGKVLRKLNKDIGYYNKQGKMKLYTYDGKNYDMLTQKAIQFNTQSEYRRDYVAIVDKVQDNESHRTFLSLSVKARNKMNSITSDNMEYNYKLNTRLKEILAANGIARSPDRP